MSQNAVIITGGAKRVGAALSLYFAKAGYDIALNYHSSESTAQSTQTQIQALGVQCQLFQHDLMDTKGIPLFMQRIQKAMPHCNLLINNASVFERAFLMDTDESLFDRQLTTNLKAPFFLTKAFAQCFAKGNVANIIDTDIVQNQGSHFAYLLSKKMLAEFTIMAARELGPHIRVNGVCPGDMFAQTDMKPQEYETHKSHLPLKQFANPEALGDTIHWLVGQSHVTGQIIYVDGGKHAH